MEIDSSIEPISNKGRIIVKKTIIEFFTVCLNLFILPFFNKDKNHITPKTEDNVKAMASIIMCGRNFNCNRDPVLNMLFVNNHPLVV